MAKPYQHKPCRACGGEKERNSRGRVSSWYCKACTDVLWKKYDRNLCGSKAQDHANYSCVACQRIKCERRKEAAQRATVTRAKNHPKWAKPVNAERFWQDRAHGAVAAAIKHGLLPSLKSGEYACTDCGGVAHEYDHRDYGRPLDVQPVCRSCNRRRGTATWPRPVTFPRVAGSAVQAA